jgi:hypothetical protein
MRMFMVVVFPGETRAFQGFRALEQLHRNASVTLYASALIEVDENGALSVRKRGHEIPVGHGTLIDGLKDPLELVARELAPGTFAVVAEIWEEWATRIDEQMEPLGGRVVFEWRTEVGDDWLEQRASPKRLNRHG